MAVQRQDGFLMDARPSGADLTGKERYLAKRDSSGDLILAQVGDIVAGVIQQGRTTGLWSTIMTGGMAKVVAGETISEGVKVQAGANGVTVAGTTNSYGVSRSQANSGEMLEVIMDQS